MECGVAVAGGEEAEGVIEGVLCGGCVGVLRVGEGVCEEAGGECEGAEVEHGEGGVGWLVRRLLRGR